MKLFTLHVYKQGKATLLAAWQQISNIHCERGVCPPYSLAHNIQNVESMAEYSATLLLRLCLT